MAPTKAPSCDLLVRQECTFGELPYREAAGNNARDVRILGFWEMMQEV